jgi:hypothetical protein
MPFLPVILGRDTRYLIYSLANIKKGTAVNNISD